MAGKLAEWTKLLESRVEERWVEGLVGVLSVPDVLRPGIVEEDEEADEVSGG